MLLIFYFLKLKNIIHDIFKNNREDINLNFRFYQINKIFEIILSIMLKSRYNSEWCFEQLK